MRAGRQGNRSSLLSHTFPSFYACYLLKSVQTPTSKATYIGSTPNPPRRIRQHNGELTQGAYKTKRGRPWIMQLIVHGFPSKLAALQFEWAWQHPNLSRHIRDENGKVFTTTGRGLKQNIQILRFMISIHPYNLWPLHVKIFTPQALKIWDGLAGTQGKGKGKEKATNSAHAVILPRGFTHTVELEGVDGKLAGGTGRSMPIDVQDGAVYLCLTTHLNKHNDLIASTKLLQCSVCREPLNNYISDPLTHALCPHNSCNGTAHLLCLSQHFISQSLSGKCNLSDAPMVPRGGNCPSCFDFVLWGDVVKGCYRRSAGGAVSVEEDEEALEKMYKSDSLAEDTSSHDHDPGRANNDNAKGKKRKAKRVVSPRKKREREGCIESSTSSLGEEFDFDEVEEERYSDDPEVVGTSRRRMATSSPTKFKIGNAHLTIPTPVTPSAPTRTREPQTTLFSSSPTPRKQVRVIRSPKDYRESSEGELFDFDHVERLSSTDDDEAPKRKVGRPKKVLNVDGAASSRPTGTAKRRGRPRKDSLNVGLSSTSSKTPMKKLSNSSRRMLMSRPLGKLAAAPLESQRSDVLPLYLSDSDDDILVHTMSSLSVSSPSSSI
ncbi:hypothetical protein C8R41DRAFT_810768 [Lentinula lateritia]|uniref:GIY-YIG domain-containing protein n=1 Tax=Lentinula lateritia TaxID=40482 RepID=A0ABQ8VXN3_9AGAR|nr:hypothetical protein C8R41DRAFT_810768 [Lentinula lateritia]